MRTEVLLHLQIIFVYFSEDKISISLCVKLLKLVGWFTRRINGADEDSITCSVYRGLFFVLSSFHSVSSIF